MSVEHGVLSAIRLIHKLGGNALQIATGPPDNTVIIPWPANEIDTILKIRQKHNIYIVVHGKFIYNFAHDIPSAKWQRDLLVKELQQANTINSDVVIHQGKNVNKLSKTKAICNFVNNLTIVLESTKDLSNRIILENSAHQGTEMGYTLDELSEIYHMFDAKCQDRIGICWDLCHGFVAGQDLRKPDIAQEHMKRMIRSFGRNTHFLVHFNDSNVQYDSKNDNHAPLCCGYIGNSCKGGSDAGFRVIAEMCHKHQIPMIMETGPCNIEGEIAMIKQWIN